MFSELNLKAIKSCVKIKWLTNTQYNVQYLLKYFAEFCHNVTATNINV